MKQHTGPDVHDGYAPHSHEIRADHAGVPGISDDARRELAVTAELDALRQELQGARQRIAELERAPAGDTPLTPQQHAAGASRLLREIDGRMRDEQAPRSLLELAAVALAHAVTSLAAGGFRDEGGSAAAGKSRPSPLRDRILAAMRGSPRFRPGAGGVTAQDLALALLVPSPAITAELGQLEKSGLAAHGDGISASPDVWFLTPAGKSPAASLRDQIVLWLPGPAGPTGWTATWLARLSWRPESEVLAELTAMEEEGLVRQYQSSPETSRWLLT